MKRRLPYHGLGESPHELELEFEYATISRIDGTLARVDIGIGHQASFHLEGHVIPESLEVGSAVMVLVDQDGLVYGAMRSIETSRLDNLLCDNSNVHHNPIHKDYDVAAVKKMLGVTPTSGFH